jgi:hypothetical protein
MDANAWAGVAAVFVAALALGVSIWEGVASRRHNRLSVRPALVMLSHMHGRRELCVLLRNAGFGPAVIQSFLVEVLGDDGRPVTLTNPLDLRLNPGLGAHAAYGIVHPGDVIAAQSEVALIQFDDSVAFGSPEHRDALKKLKRIVFRIRYESLYGEPLELVDTPFGHLDAAA